MANCKSSLVFIDAQLEAYLQLQESIASTQEVLILEPQKDGIEQITQTLRQRPNAAEIHILAHGIPGCLYLGSSRLALSTLTTYTSQLGRWFNGSLGRLYLYGCSVAAGDAGAEFLAHLRRLTGASIAASTGRVGHTRQGGSWQLDRQLGEMPARSLLTATQQAAYPGVLAAPSNDNFANAQLLTGTSANAAGTNVEATAEIGESIHDPTVSGLSAANQQALNDSVWWKWTAPTSGQVTVNTFGSSIDTVLAAYTGTAANSLTQVARNNDANGTLQSSLTFIASANTTYYFAVDGVGGAQGSLNITLDTPAAIAANQVFQVSENAATGAAIGSVKANEASLSWSIAAGNPDNDGDGKAAFAINAATGALTVNDADDLDFERYSQLYALDVTANDGSFTSAGTVFVNVTDSADSPDFKSLSSSLSVLNEGSKISLSGQFNDPDQADQQTVTISWGDGTTTIIDSDNLSLPDATGLRTFSGINHTYRDNGSYAISVSVVDSTGGSDMATTSVTVNNVAPTLAQGSTASLSLSEDSSTTLLLNATDPSVLDGLTWSISKASANGTASVSQSPTGSNQIITYAPTANFSGVDTFEVQVRDDDGGVDTITVNVTVAAQPDAPSSLSLVKSAAILNEGQALTLSGSFADPDVGDAFTVRIQWGDGSADTVLPNSALVNNGSGGYTFSTSHTYADDTGGVPVGINVVVQDSSGAIASASTAITVNNLAPTVTPGPTTSFSTPEDTAATLTFTASDPADTRFTWQISSGPSNGSVSLSSNPNSSTQAVTYTPSANFNGVDSFKIAVNDDDGGISIVEVLVGVDPVNDAPQALTLTASSNAADEGQSVTLSGSFQDVDLTDKHAIAIDWGDGSQQSVTSLSSGGSSFTLPAGLSHTYRDEGSYIAKVTVTDSSGAAVTSTTTFDIANVAPVIATPNGSVSIEALTVGEDKSVSQLISASDVGVLDVLVWSVSTPPANGSVEIVPTGVGAQQQLKYTPNGNFSGVDSFTVQVSDGDGGIDTLLYNVTVQDVNDAPQLLTNQFNLTEGGTLLLTPDVLDATDVETTDDAQIKFTVSGLASGDVFKVNGATSNSFSRADLLNGSVSFIDNGDEIAPTFTIAVSDGSASVSAPANIKFTQVNDAPLFAAGNTPFAVVEGGTTLVRAANISASDAETTNASVLVFTVSNVVGGQFLRSGTPVTQFTQADINGSLISFRHDGGEAAPSYRISVSDGVSSSSRNDVPSFVALNDAPQFLSNRLTVSEGGTVTLATSDLSASDVETLPNDLLFTVTGITGGTFLVNNVAQGAIATFRLEDVVLGKVAFQHNGSETVPSYSVQVSDGGSPAASTSSSPTVTFSRVNDNPSLTANTFSLTEGGTVLLSQLNLNGADEAGETPRLALTYRVSNVVGGRFALGTAQGTAITSFSQSDIDNRRVVFVHDGSDTTPAYTLTVSDSEGGSASSSSASIILTRINEAPTLKTNTLTLGEGQSVVLSQANLLATDEESTPDKLTYEITGLSGGQFVLSGKSTLSFTQADVNAGLVSFVHDGGNAAPTYSVKVTDTVPAGPVAAPAGPLSATGAPTIQFTAVNDAPTLTAAAFAIQEGQSVVLSSSQLLAADEETTSPASLVYTVDQVSNGTFQLAAGGPPLTTFTQADINGGKVKFVHDGSELAPSYTLTVRDTGITGNPAAKSATQSVSFAGQFTNLNDLPQLLTNTLAIAEGAQVTLTPANLNVADLETPSNDLQISVSSIVGGTFLLDGVPFSGPVQFSLADVVLQRISFRHNGSETVPSYAVTVTDANGGASGPSSVTLSSFSRVNDNPNIIANGFSLTEGGRLILSQANIDAVDEAGETARAALRYSVSNVVGGQFESSSVPGVAIAAFTQAEIDSGRVVFVHDGSDTPPRYTLTVADSEGGSDSEPSPAVTFTRVNQPPTLLNNQLTLAEGGTVVLSQANLLATDEESAAGGLTYSISSLSGGQFWLNGAATTSFTQAEINSGLISFVHDGGNAAPQYSVTVTDAVPAGPVSNPGPFSASGAAAVSFTALNDAPLLTASAYSISEGEAVVLSSAVLAASDEETADPASLIYSVDQVSRGAFQRVATGATLASFSQADINAGRVQFVHDGSEAAPSYTLTVKDSGIAASPTPKTASQTIDFTGSFTNLNDLPRLLASSFAISEGGSLVLTTANFNADDLETNPADLVFTLDGLVGGKVQIDGIDLPTGPINFTLADVVLGRLSFVHDGSETPPAFTVSVSDGTTATMPVAATLSYTRLNDRPEITINQFALSEGGTVILSAANLSATDELGETPQASLRYTVSNVQGGRFALLSNSAQAITSFIQADIDRGLVVFVHDGSDTSPSYLLTVTDGDGGTDVETTPAITFTRVNQPPSLVTNQLSLSEGNTVVLSQTNLLSNDEESSPGQLTYSISGLSGGAFMVGGVATTRFTQADINSGLVSFVHDGSNVAPQYSVTVTDMVPTPPVANPAGPFSTSGAAAISFTALNDAPTLTASPFEITEGAAVVLTAAMLSASDEETTNPAGLTYTIESVTSGEFQQVATGTAVTSFTQDDINNNRVQFKHNDSELAPSYSLTLKDSGLPGNSAPASTTVAVSFPDGPGGFINVNNLPTLTTNQLSVQEGSKIVFSPANLSASDDDSLVSQLSYRIASVTGGTFFLNGVAIDGTTRFNAAAVAFGRLSFQDDGDEVAPAYTIEVSDPEGGTVTQAASVNLLPVNDSPVLVNNTFAISEDGLLELSSANLLAIDAETTSPAQLVYRVSDLSGGAFVLFSGGPAIASFTQAQVNNKEIVFLQDGSELAPSFTLTVSDAGGGSTTAKANVSFNATNDAPVLVANRLTLVEGGSVVLSPNDLAAFDPDTAPASLVFTVSGLAVGQGQFELDSDGDGTFETTGVSSFTQQQVANGRVRFVDDGDEAAPTYSLSVKDELSATAAQAATISFSSKNDPPVAADDSGPAYLTTQNTVFTTGVVLDNDTDAEGDLLSITQVDGKAIAVGTPLTLASGALLSLNSNGSFSYSPNSKFNALAAAASQSDSFVYTLSDGKGGSDTATVNLVVNGLNDNPVAGDDGGQGFSTNEGSVLTTPGVLINDTDVDTGDTLSITQVNGQAIAVGGSVTLASGAKVSLNANGTFLYDLNGQFEALSAGQLGQDSFAYTLSDAVGGSDTATVTIALNGQNDAPVANQDSGLGFSTNEDTAFTTASVLTNDTDIDAADQLSVLQVNGIAITAGGPAVAIASGAKVSLNANGTFTYDPNGAFEALSNGNSAIDTFSYAVGDGNGGTAASTVDIVISGLNDVPNAADDSGAVSEHRSLRLSVLANDLDTDPGDVLTVGQIGGSAIAPGGRITLASGSLVLLNADQSLTYVPLGFGALAAGQSATDRFTYTLFDSQGQPDTATVTVQIAGYTPPTTATGVFDYAQFDQYALLDRNTDITYSSFEVGGLALDQLFDEGYYLAQYSDVAAAVDAGLFASGYDHFVSQGWLQGRNPSVLYSEAFYLNQNRDIAQAVAAGAFSSGFAHFARVGHREGRNPSALFSQQDYLLNNPDVAQQVARGNLGSGFEHYVESGSAENRLPSLFLYNESYYLQRNPDVAQAVASSAFASGFEHYVKVGQKEPQRNPSALFSESSYLALNPDVQVAVSNNLVSSGFEHYLESGRFEGRQVFA